MPRNTEVGTRTIHGIRMDRDGDGSYVVTMPDRWFYATPENDAEDNLEGELCMLLDHLWDAAGVTAIDGPRRGPVADGSQTPNDAAAIPRAKAGSNTGAASGVLADQPNQEKKHG